MKQDLSISALFAAFCQHRGKAAALFQDFISRQCYLSTLTDPVGALRAWDIDLHYSSDDGKSADQVI